RRYRAEVAASDRAADIALLRIAKPNVSPRRVADAPPALAAEVYLAGYPRGGAYRSWVTRRTKLYESAGRVEVSGHSENGTSGGPMIDARGRVVSIISTTQRAGRQPWTTSGCSTECLRKILRPKPRMTPIQKPTPRPPATPARPTIDYDKLASLVAARIPRPPRGEKGEPGRQGPAGPPGKDADAVELTQLRRRLAELERRVQSISKSTPAYFEIVPREK
ncbi:MAG: serine protease, partial [Pirellulales bacterium]|nr:serine protease [Pirellulales bacterium]